MFEYTDNIHSMDTKLAEGFNQVTWIGELPLTERDFRLLAGSVRMYECIDHIPPRVLIVTMVFCARFAEFAENENISFWKKYFQDVLKRDKTPVLENKYRDAFRAARDHLQAEYNFEFPTRDETTQEVVSGVYMHAILPAYLQEDFAEFFLKQYPNRLAWEQLSQQFPDQIAVHNEASTFAAPVRKRLIHFLQHPDTSITAARLISNMGNAALWHNEGEDTGVIESVLAPIEQAVWRQILPLLPIQGTEKATTARTLSSRVRWAWLIEQNDILELLVTNLSIIGDVPPDRLVWLPATEGTVVTLGEQVPEYGRNYCEVNAYHVASGYVIDTATLIDIDGQGVVVPVDQNDNALANPLPTGAPPPRSAAFFRIQQDGQLAVLSDQSRLIDGEYAVSLPTGVTLKAAEGGMLKRVYPLLVPKALKDQGHDSAAQYELMLPIMLGDQRIDKRRSRIPPTLDGQNPVYGLTPGALTIYEQGNIWLRMTPPAGVPLERLSLRLTNNDKVSIYRLSELDAKGQINRVMGNGQSFLHIRLCDYISPACLLQVEIFSGVTRMHGDPRLAGVLPPHVNIVCDPIDCYYTPQQPPKVRINGVMEDQIILASDARVEAVNEGVLITWIDPRQDSALRLRFDNVILPLTFHVKWSHAWVAPLIGHYLWEEALSQAVLSVRGAPRSDFSITVGDGTPRSYQLNARGVMDVRLIQDALADMLHDYQGERAPVKLRLDGSDDVIELFTFIRPQFSDFESQPQPVKAAIRAFKAVMRQERRNPAQADSYWLMMLPPDYSAMLPEAVLPPQIKTLRASNLDLHPHARAIFPQRSYQLCLSASSYYPIFESGGQRQIRIRRPHSGGEDSVSLMLDARTDGVYLKGANGHLRQCRRCGDLFWVYDKTAKFKHTHNQVGIDARDLTASPVIGKIESVPLAANELRVFTPNFDAFIQRDLEYALRIRRPNQARDLSQEAEAPVFTHKAYTQATARWVVRVGSTYQINTQFAELYKSFAWVDQVCLQLFERDNPALIFSGRWIAAERKHRKTQDWQMLDPVIMTLAVIGRAYAHGNSTFLTEDQEQKFSNLLKLAYHCCPHLLNWALLWAELIFNHFTKEPAI
ncbi:MAG: hypothetical protein J0M33_26045 [Anaerolineae bacterium]|nr:hypothetical protein [Anaerolineae bacterium]